jgi:hypothetical protein
MVHTEILRVNYFAEIADPINIEDEIWVSNGAESILLKVSIVVDDNNFIGETVRELLDFLPYHQVGSLLAFERKNILRIERKHE